MKKTIFDNEAVVALIKIIGKELKILEEGVNNGLNFSYEEKVRLRNNLHTSSIQLFKLKNVKLTGQAKKSYEDLTNYINDSYKLLYKISNDYEKEYMIKYHGKWVKGNEIDKEVN